MTSAGRIQLVFLGLLTAVTFSACGGGGGGGGGSALPPIQKSTATPVPFSIVSQSGNNVEVRGTIYALISGGFAFQGGPSTGYLHVYTNSSTLVVGAQPYANESVDVVATGTIASGDLYATKVTQLNAPSATPSPSPSPTPSPSSAPASPTPVPSASPTPTAVPTSSATSQPVYLPTGVLQQTAQVVGATPTRLTVLAGSCGSMYVYLNASTTYFDGTPRTGQNVSVTGTGTKCSALTAVALAVSGSAFASSTFSGTVQSATPYGFILTTANANVPVALYSATVVYGATLSVGSQVTVTALGTSSTGLTATMIAVAPPPTPTPNPSSSPTPTPGPISTTHVQTFNYTYGYGGTPTSVALSSMTPYINWAMTDEPHAAELRAAGLKVAIYMNYWRNYSSDNPLVGYNDLKPGGLNAAAEALDCNNNVIVDPSYGGGYEADPRTANAFAHASVVESYIASEFAGNFDAIFADDTGAVGGITTPCGYVESTYDQAVNTVHAAMSMPIWVNALGAAPNPASATDLVQPANVLGAMCELCYSGNGSSGDYIQTGTQWVNVENAEIETIAQGKTFWDYARATGSASGETSLRTYTYASFLLSYDPQFAMFQEALSTPSGFPVMPETQLVPMNPLTTQSSVAGYQAPGGSYFREFGACYYAGSYVGPCAIVVNPSAGSEPVPSTSYSHSLQLSGAGVLDGGSVSFAGGAVTQLAAGSAAILFP